MASLPMLRQVSTGQPATSDLNFAMMIDAPEKETEHVSFLGVSSNRSVERSSLGSDASFSGLEDLAIAASVTRGRRRADGKIEPILHGAVSKRKGPKAPPGKAWKPGEAVRVRTQHITCETDVAGGPRVALCSPRGSISLKAALPTPRVTLA